MLQNTMPDLRAAVEAKMKKDIISAYALVKMLKGKRPGGRDVPAPTIYQWLRGDNPLNSDDLGLVLDVLGLDVTPTRRKREK